MGMRIEESFEVQAPPERVWSYLIDPRQVVRCLPGAELLDVQDERNFTGQLRVKVGPVTAGFRGRARFEELLAGERRVRMVGEGQEKSGGGTARMTMTSRVVALPNGGARVEVDAEVDVVGRLVQFGRGMIEEVSRQMFAQFADCARSQLEGAAERPAADATAVGSASQSTTRVVTTPGGAAGAEARPLRLLPLLYSALRARIRRLFGGGPGER